MKKKFLLCVALAGVLSVREAHPKSKAPKVQPPNIILINVDDLGWTDVGYNGSTYYETPNIDRLHSQGIYFRNGYAGGANSAPSRACLLSGLNTPRHGVYTVNPPDRGRSEDRKLIPYENRMTLDSSVYTLPMALKTAGYQTCHIGKWHVGTDPLAQGVDINIAGNESGHPNSYFAPYGNRNLADGPEGEYLTDRLSLEAVRYLENVDKDRPFFLYYATYEVHTPLQAKPELIEKYKNKKASEAHNNPVYAAMVESMDQAVGRVLEAVEKNGLAGNTFIVLTSDNGGVYNISRQWPLRAGKGSFYEGGIRVPFIVYMKDKYEGGVTSGLPVTHLDLYPTFTELAGTDPVIRPDGESLLPYLDNGKTKYLEKRSIYFHLPAYLEGGNPETKDSKFRSRPVSVVRRGDWKLFRNYEDGSYELYNLKDDISEKNDLARERPDIVKKMAKDLDKWLKKTDAPVPSELNPGYKGDNY